MVYNAATETGHQGPLSCLLSTVAMSHGWEWLSLGLPALATPTAVTLTSWPPSAANAPACAANAGAAGPTPDAGSVSSPHLLAAVARVSASCPW